MTRLPQIANNEANPQQAELFAAAKQKLGRVPNFLRALANSPAALKGYLGLSAAVGATEGLDAQQREAIALVVGQANGCDYCLAAHSTLGKMVGLSPEEIQAARRGEGADDAVGAVVRFASAVLESRGRVSDDEIQAFRNAGFGDDAIAEVVAHVALNVYTNYFNNVAQPEVDFPAAPPLEQEQLEAVACSTGSCSV